MLYVTPLKYSKTVLNSLDMIHKFWNVRYKDVGESCQKIIYSGDAPRYPDGNQVDERVLDSFAVTQGRISWIWRVLSAFEESCTTCISDALLHVDHGARKDSVVAFGQLITYVGVLFKVLDQLTSLDLQNFSNGKFFSLRASLRS